MKKATTVAIRGLIVFVCSIICVLALLDCVTWHPEYIQGMDRATVVLIMIMIWAGIAGGVIFVFNLILYGRKP